MNQRFEFPRLLVALLVPTAIFVPRVDWLFGTLHLPKGEMPKRYGIDEPMAAT